MKSQITRFISGIGIIIIGVALLLANLDVPHWDAIVANGWPLIIIGAGILMFVSDVKNYLWALLVVGIGVALQLRELDIVTINVFQLFWPAVIVVIGLSIIFNRSSNRRISKDNSDDVSAIMSGIDHKNNADDYEGGQVTAIMGGVKIDLRKATIKKQATLNVFALMGGVEVWVPANVVVKSKASCLVGGIENKTTTESSKNAPVLYITGDVIMSGVEIKN